MSSIKFESARDKEQIRQDLRDAREQMLEKAKQSAELRLQSNARKVLNGEAQWMLPAVSAKIDKVHKEKTLKKKRKSKKKASKNKKPAKKCESDCDESTSNKTQRKKSKKKAKSSKSSRKKSETSSDSSCSESSDEKHKRRKKRKYSSTESSSDSDEWVEKVSPGKSNTQSNAVLQRDSWMIDTLMLKTYSREKSVKNPNENRQMATYDPAHSSRELNTYWKSTGTGLPTSFRKPRNDSDEEKATWPSRQRVVYTNHGAAKNWQKKSDAVEKEDSRPKRYKNISATQSEISSSSAAPSDDEKTLNEHNKSPPSKSSYDSKGVQYLTDQQMNQLGAKIIKVEILGQNDLAKELKKKLELARADRERIKQGKEVSKNEGVSEESHFLLTRIDNKGNCRPLQQASVKSFNPNDLYGGRGSRKKAKPRCVETHEAGERIRFFADDHKYNIKEMFEREKYTSAAESDIQFAELAGKHKNRSDDLDDIFADKIRKNISQEEMDRKELSHSIREQQHLDSRLDNCNKCLESPKMDKKSIVSMGDKVYLALPWHIGLQAGHCLLIPVQHVSCSTLLDEDTWEEISNFRKALTKMYAAQNKDVIFFEMANKLQSKPHLSIHCVPIDGKDAESAQFYFKKAIEESEYEWSVNKQLVSLRGKCLRNSIPKGLPYFWVGFGMENGFAHVIEDQERFPSYFAQEIIGGLLKLEPQKWRRPQKEQNLIVKVKFFAECWKNYDCSK